MIDPDGLLSMADVGSAALTGAGLAVMGVAGPGIVSVGLIGAGVTLGVYSVIDSYKSIDKTTEPVKKYVDKELEKLQDELKKLEDRGSCTVK